MTLQGSYVGSLAEMKRTDRARAPHRPAAVPVAHPAARDVNAVLTELRAGKVVGRVVLTPD